MRKLFFVLLMAGACCFAQQTATLTGFVTDPTGNDHYLLQGDGREHGDPVGVRRIDQRDRKVLYTVPDPGKL